MLGAYLTQTAAYQAALRDVDGLVMDKWGQAQYAAAVARPCRRQQKAREFLTANGQAIKTTTVYYLEDEVFEGDLLDGKRVAEVSLWANLGGGAIGWKAVC